MGALPRTAEAGAVISPDESIFLAVASGDVVIV